MRQWEEQEYKKCGGDVPRHMRRHILQKQANIAKHIAINSKDTQTHFETTLIDIVELRTKINRKCNIDFFENHIFSKIKSDFLKSVSCWKDLTEEKFDYFKHIEDIKFKLLGLCTDIYKYDKCYHLDYNIQVQYTIPSRLQKVKLMNIMGVLLKREHFDIKVSKSSRSRSNTVVCYKGSYKFETSNIESYICL